MNKVLIVVDYQNDFADPNGALYVPEAETIADKIQQEIDNPIYSDIIYTLDTHTIPEYKNSKEAELFPEHCVFNTKGWFLHKIKPRKNVLNRMLKEKCFNDPIDFSIGEEFVFIKDRFSIWEGNKDFEKFISCRYDEEYTEFAICGLATNYCVFMNAMGFKDMLFKNVTILEDCVRGIHDDTYDLALEEMKKRNIKFVGGSDNV